MDTKITTINNAKRETVSTISTTIATIFGHHHDDSGFEPYIPDEYAPDYSGEMIRYYSVWIILCVGIPSNLIAIIVVSCSRRLRETPSGVLLLSLTIVDTLVLVCTRLATLSVNKGLEDKWVDIDENTLTALYYLLYSGRCAASFIVAAISINRCVITVCPPKSAWFKRPRNAVVQVCIAVVLAALVNVYVIKYPPLVNQYCQHCYFVGILFVEILLTDIIVSLVIIILSGITIRSLVKRRQTTAELATNERALQHRTRQATVLLLVVAITYVVLRVQYKVVWVPVFVMEYLTGAGPGGLPTALRNAYYVTYCLFLLNHATNLYQYCLCLMDFRREFCRLFCPLHIQKKIMRRLGVPSTTSSTSSSQRLTGTVATAL